MIKNHFLLTLVSLFVISAPLMACKPKGLGKRSITPPGLSTKPDAQDKKEVAEQPAAQAAQKPANLAAAGASQTSAASSAGEKPAAQTANQTPNLAAAIAPKASTNSPMGNPTEKAIVTLKDLILRNGVIKNVSWQKSYGACLAIINALKAMKESAEQINCADSDNQAQFGSAVADVKTNVKSSDKVLRDKAIKETVEFVSLARSMKLQLAKEYGEDLAAILKVHQDDEEALFTAHFKQHCTKSKEVDELLDFANPNNKRDGNKKHPRAIFGREINGCFVKIEQNKIVVAEPDNQASQNK